MNHKLRVLVQVDLDPGRVTLEAAGCLTLLEPAELPVCPIRASEAGPELVPSVLSLIGAAGHRPVPGGKLTGLVEAGSAR